jgi:peptide/nickel transport system permease protein
MARFLVRRTGTAILVIFITSILVFVGVRAIPGNPVTVLAGEQMATGEALPDRKMNDWIRRKYDLGQPLPVQYAHWVWLLLHGDFGRNQQQQPIGEMIAQRLPVTAELSVLAVLMAVIIGIPLGVISAVRRGRATDHLTTSGAVLALSVPNVWLPFLLVTWFAVDLHWLPSGGYRSISHPVSNLDHLVLPVIVVGYGIAAGLVRQTRASMLDSLGADYIRTARAKGLKERAVVGRHALRNSLITVVTVLGMMFVGLLGGAAIAETIFGIPGYGQLTITAINNRDYPLVEATVLVTVVLYVLMSLMVDFAYTLLNPRIRVS